MLTIRSSSRSEDSRSSRRTRCPLSTILSRRCSFFLARCSPCFLDLCFTSPLCPFPSFPLSLFSSFPLSLFPSFPLSLSRGTIRETIRSRSDSSRVPTEDRLLFHWQLSFLRNVSLCPRVVSFSTRLVFYPSRLVSSRLASAVVRLLTRNDRARLVRLPRDASFFPIVEKIRMEALLMSFVEYLERSSLALNEKRNLDSCPGRGD